ncbi:T9SS type A sorting domain-containing protein [candidate division GN15 bacterium]|nr:T9SS type A sorting domain-containing protein [candidate division GN15 bacterium]
MSTISRRWTVPCVLAVLALALLAAGPLMAKSLYLSANHHTGQFDAWNINPDGSATRQATYGLQYSTDPAGIGIDAVTDNDEPIMFISSEFSPGLEIVNPITLEYIGVSSGPSNLGGVDVDDVDNIVYSVRRQSNELYIFLWDPVAGTLTHDATIILPNLQYAYGLAFDDSRDILWVGDTPNSLVRAYDMDVASWGEIAEIPSLAFSVSHPPVDITVDTRQNFVYTSGGWAGSSLISKYDVNTGVETTVNCGGAMGIAVDEVTGYVYITRGQMYGGGSLDDLQVWDCSSVPFVLLQDTPDMGNPAGIAIPNLGGVSYNPLNLAKNDQVQGVGVPIGQNFTYEITFDNFDNDDEVTGVQVVDNLPVELDFISETLDGAPGTGVYDPVAHTVTWDIGTVPAQAEGPVILLEVLINNQAVEGQTIYNYATIESDQTPGTTVVGTDPDDTTGGEGTTPTEPEPDGSLFGVVENMAGGMHGVTVDVFQGAVLYTSVMTDATGAYAVDSLPNGDYSVEVAVPLGYVPVTDPVVAITVASSDEEVNFLLDKAQPGQLANVWWWKTYLANLRDGGPRANMFTEDDINNWGQLIYKHFYSRPDMYAIQIEGVTYAGSPAGPMTFDDVCYTMLDADRSTYEARVRYNLLANLLNIVSLRMHQASVVTQDGATASQAITHFAQVYMDNAGWLPGEFEKRNNLIQAYHSLRDITMGRLLPAGVVPLTIPQIAYKTGDELLPGEYALEQNYPNPFNPVTKIQFALPTTANVKLEVFNMAGQQVDVLYDGMLGAGSHIVTWDGAGFASGVYLYRLTSDTFVESRKMMLLK